MVSKKLQDKFYAALESMKDGKNDYILEALMAGAKASFESFGNPGYVGKLHADVPEEKDDPYSEDRHEAGTNWPSKDAIANAADDVKVPLAEEDMLVLSHDPSTEDEDETRDLVDIFDDRSGRRFPTYRGQFYEKDYPAVAEAIDKLGKTIGAMKRKGNEAMVESIQAAYAACFR
jgi:hypothetical protein